MAETFKTTGAAQIQIGSDLPQRLMASFRPALRQDHRREPDQLVAALKESEAQGERAANDLQPAAVLEDRPTAAMAPTQTADRR